MAVTDCSSMDGGGAGRDKVGVESQVHIQSEAVFLTLPKWKGFSAINLTAAQDGLFVASSDLIFLDSFCVI